MKGMHPVFAQALKPFAPPANDPAPNFLRLPFEVQLGDDLVTADPRDVAQAFEESIDKHMPVIEERIAELTMQRLHRDRDESRIDRHAA